MSGWRPALRIARRTVRRSLARSLLIAILVGLPVAGATFVDVLVRTLSNPEREVTRSIGSADASIEVTPRQRLRHYTPSPWAGYEGGRRDISGVDVESMLPTGSRLTRVPVEYEVRLDHGDAVVRTWLKVADVTDELVRHEAQLVEGTAPAEGEILVSEALAERLDLLDSGGELVSGASVTLHDGDSASIGGLSRSAFCLSCERMVVPPGSALHQAAAAAGEGRSDLGAGSGEGMFLVDLPAGTDVEALWTDLAENGVALVPRDAYLHPERYEGLDHAGVEVSPEAVAAAALAALIVGLGLLEVVLLAGTAFAVGSRRQVRDLGVIAAAGATGKQIRRIVLAQGFVLGVLGSIIGIAFGGAAALLGKPVWQRLDDALITDWEIGPLEIAGAAVVGAVSGLLAAIIPAIGAGRMAPVDALSGRFRVSRAQRRRSPLIGLASAATGSIAAVVGDRMLADDFADYRAALAEAGNAMYVSAPTPILPLVFIVGGATFVVVGLVILSPVIIGWISGIGRVLPLSARLAVRDAARHRHRTGPATSAIAVAVAGSIVLAFVVAGNGRADELQYVPSLPDNMMSVTAWDTTDPAAAQAEAAAAAAGELPDPEIVTVQEISGEESAGLEPMYGSVWVEEQLDPATCRDGCVSVSQTLAVATGGIVERVVGADSAVEAREALEAGKVVVTAETQLDRRGRVHLVDDSTGKAKLLPGHLIERTLTYYGIPSALISRPVVNKLGWHPIAGQTWITYASSATADQVDTAVAAAEDSGAEAYVETGPGSDTGIILLVAAIAAGFVTLVGVTISVALSAAEGRADLATLAAVGAAPRRRRSLAAAQALLVGGLGCLLGLALGTFVSFTLRATTGSPELVVPWVNLAAVGLAVPLLAVLVAAVCTPSRLPLVRRAE